MKKLIFAVLITFVSVSVYAQPTFDLGLKAGLNNSKISFDASDYNSETVLKMHIGAFTRLGWGKIYVQPEAYFSAKGAEVKSTLLETSTQFDFNNIDVPVLLGVKVLDGAAANLRVMGGPVFSFVISGDVEHENFFDPDYYKDNYFGFQYGVGVDILNFFVDARMEHGTNNLYYHPSADIEGKNQTFMVSVGFKIL